MQERWIEPVRVACPECDLPVAIEPLADRERAVCPRCRHVLAAGSVARLERSLAYAIAASILLVLANTFPFLSFSHGGLGNEMTLLQSAWALFEGGSETLGLLVLGFIVAIPAAMLILILLIVIPLLSSRRAPWLVRAGRVIFALQPWSMAEVFIIGVIASLVKIAGMATVTLGISFWSYAGFAVFFACAMSSLDRFTVWAAIERLSR
jgi:paraquat-inducible protein A